MLELAVKAGVLDRGRSFVCDEAPFLLLLFPVRCSDK